MLHTLGGQYHRSHWSSKLSLPYFSKLQCSLLVYNLVFEPFALLFVDPKHILSLSGLRRQGSP